MVLTPVIRGILASDDVTIDDNLKTNGDVTVGGNLLTNSILPRTGTTMSAVGNFSVSGILTNSFIQSSGVDGISLVRSAGSTALRV